MTLAMVLQAGAGYGQFNLSECAWGEIGCLRQQILEQADVVDPTAPDFVHVDKWVGAGARQDSALISPDRGKQVASEVKDESDVFKERRKAREEAAIPKKK